MSDIRDSAKATMEKLHAKYGKEIAGMSADLLMSATLTSEVLAISPVLGLQLADVFSTISSKLIAKFDNPEEVAEKVFACIKEIQEASEEHAKQSAKAKEIAHSLINHLKKRSET